jgi:hypothetical protein
MAPDAPDVPVARIVSAEAERTRRARYLPIAEHGLIGDLHAAALVGTDGRDDRLVLLSALRFAERLRDDPPAAQRPRARRDGCRATHWP